MHISFKNTRLRSLCESEELAAKELGQETTNKLKARLNDLIAASSIEELIVGNPRVEDDFILLDLEDNYKMVLGVGHSNKPKTREGKTDWSRVTRIKLLDITDN